MELTSERKQQIEQEEQYRAYVRAGLDSGAASGWRSFPRILLVVMGVSAAVLLAVVFLGRTTRISPSAITAQEERFNQTIGSDRVEVAAHGTKWYRIEVTPEMNSAKLVGHFRVAGGSRNDIESALVPAKEFPNWMNGHQTVAYYRSGRKTTDSFAVTLAPGTYYLVFDNRFSVFSRKHIALEASLKYTRTVSN